MNERGPRRAPNYILVLRHRKQVRMRRARKVVANRRYFYVNPAGVRHACNGKLDAAGELVVVFSDNAELPVAILRGEFYHRS